MWLDPKRKEHIFEKSYVTIKKNMKLKKIDNVGCSRQIKCVTKGTRSSMPTIKVAESPKDSSWAECYKM